MAVSHRQQGKPLTNSTFVEFAGSRLETMLILNTDQIVNRGVRNAKILQLHWVTILLLGGAGVYVAANLYQDFNQHQ